jgi:hypothetical protein
MRNLLGSIDIWIEERATPHAFLVIQTVIALAITAVIVTDHTPGVNNNYQNFDEDCDLSQSMNYFGSLCAVVAACCAPFLDLSLELVELMIRRGEGGQAA